MKTRGRISKQALWFLLIGFMVLFPVAVLLLGMTLVRTSGYTGLQVDHRGRVVAVHPESPAAAAGLIPGDSILRINGSPDWEVLDHLAAGEEVLITWQRGTQHYTAHVRATPYPRDRLWPVVWPLLSALAFWVAGTRLLLSTHRLSDDARRFVVFAYLAAAELFAGRLQTIVPSYATFLLLVSVGAAFSYVHFHRFFPFPVRSSLLGRGIVWHEHAGRALLVGGGGLALWSVMYPSPSVTTGLTVLVVAYLLLARLLVWGTLVYGYVYGDTQRVLSRIRLIASATGLVLLFTLLALITAFVFPAGQRIPANLSMISQVLIPIAYLVALRREDFYTVDRVLNRALVYTLAVLVLAGLHWATVFLLMWGVGRQISTSPLLHSFLGASLAVLFAPLRDSIAGMVNTFFYGREKDMLSASQRLSRALVHCRTEEELAHLLTTRLPRVFGASGAVWLVWRDGHGWTCHTNPDRILDAEAIAAVQAVSHQLVDRPVLRASEAHHLAPSAAVDPTALPSHGLFLCLAPSSHLRSVLWLGPKASDDMYTEQELRLLRLLVAPGTLALENCELNRSLATRTTELQYLHHALVMADERIRRQLAHELHDRIMQDIYGQLYVLRARQETTQKGNDEELKRVQHTLERIVEDLRRLCHGLRPPLLEELGLVPALRALVNEYRETAPHLLLEARLVELPQRLPAEVESSLFAIAKSALTNVIRHSQASRTGLTLEYNGQTLLLEVWDNGRGFTVPNNWTPLLKSERFGLAGMHERARMIGATFHVASSPGNGTRVTVSWPLPQPVSSAC